MPAAHIVLQNARSRFLPLHKSSRILAMTGPGPQQNSTMPVSPLVVANAHTNGDEELLFLGVCPALFAPNRSTIWACTFSLWRLCRRSDCNFCQGDPRHVWELGLNPPCDLETSGLGNCGRQATSSCHGSRKLALAMVLTVCCQRPLLHLRRSSFLDGVFLEFHLQLINDVWTTHFLFLESVAELALLAPDNPTSDVLRSCNCGF